MAIAISRTLVDRMIAEAAADPAQEVCGLLLGEGDRIDAIRPARNVALDRARRFEIDPQVLFDAVRAERAGGMGIAGYYHSHPSGRAEPSARDAADAARDGRVWVIVAGGELTAWRMGEGGFEELPLSL